MQLDILVPKAGTPIANEVAPHSAIVSAGDAVIPGIRVVYYEGNVLGASNLREFHDRLVSAAGRLEHRYPTTAMMGVDPDDVTVVGVFDTELAAVVEILDQRLLVEWSGEGIEDICGVRLDEGVVDYQGAVTAARNGRQLERSGTTMSYRTRAGQVVELDFAMKQARVRSNASRPHSPLASPAP